MPNEIGFKSYCWSVGTTSFRTDKFNMKIERQLDLLNKFWKQPENIGKQWIGNNALQERYYYFLKSHNFLSGDADRPDKDAREKTSGLRDIGLIDDDRVITPAGEKLLAISLSENFASDNLLEIPCDSFIYFKQLLKTTIRLDKDTDGRQVRPFIVFLYVISKTKSLSYEEFAYLLPLCVDKKTTDKVVEYILNSRKENKGFEDIIISILMDKDNYKQALLLLKNSSVTESLICKIGVNRKSSNYDKVYYKLYCLLESIVFARENKALEFFECTKKITNSKIGSSWRKYFFKNATRSVIKREGNEVLKEVPILSASSKDEFKEQFFKIMHLFKAKATLLDYSDLNRRYFKLSDVVLFEDGNVKLDVLPKYYVNDIVDDLIESAFEATNLLHLDVTLEEIHPSLKIDVCNLYKKLGDERGLIVKDKNTARKVIKDERYARFNKLIDEKFDKDTLLNLLICFENRNDNEIRKLITDNADIPTYFEYVLGMAWYVISERKGDVLEYMNLSLDADLLPKTHAGGGEADIVWKYEETESYPEHVLLLEATLADAANQRRMEMEPVSRHLGEYSLANPSDEAYCIFVTPHLNLNVISDFRIRRNVIYYNSDGTENITGMKILPLRTSELRNLLKKDIMYPQVYELLDKAHNCVEEPKEWYEKNIVQQINYIEN